MVNGGPGSYRLRLNQSEVEAEIHTLHDGGILMQVPLSISLCFTLIPFALYVTK